MRALQQKSSPESVTNLPKALVIGDGLSGMMVVTALAELRIATTWVRTGSGDGSLFCASTELDVAMQEELLSARMEGVEIRTEKHSPLVSRDGNEFVVRFSDGTGSKFGCVFLTPEVEMSEVPAGLPQGTEIVSASGLTRKGMTIAFLLDYGSASPPAVGMEAIRQAADNVEAGGASIVVFRNAPVAHVFGEELYENVKRCGAQFFRYGEDPPMAVRDNAADKYRITVGDVIEAGEAVTLECDRILAAGGLDVTSLTDRAIETLETETDGEGFLISESIHCHSGRSFKNGIFSIGEATGNLDLIRTAVESAAAAVKARAWMMQAATREDEKTLEVSDQCCRCLTCHRICPHGAVAFRESEVRFHVQASAPACQECGLCVAECPRVALDLLDFPDEKFAAFLAQIRDTGGSGPVVVYGCQRSAGRIVSRANLPAEAHFLSVPCAGRISEAVLWATLRAGVAGILVVGCHPGNCASDTGTDGAAERVSKVIEKLGIGDPVWPRLKYVTVAPNETARFGRIVEEFCSVLRADAQNPAP